MQTRNEKRLQLVKNRKAKKRRIFFLLCAFLMIIGLGIYFVFVDFSIRKIDIYGNTTYTDTEIIDAMKEDGYVNNTLLMIAENQIFDQTYLPFIEKITMGYDESHVLKVKVKEKLRAGVFQYGNQYVYFNEAGIAMESRNTLFEKVPVVTGVSFTKVQRGEQIPVKGNYFRIIVSITKKIATYGLDVSEIHFQGEDDIRLVSSGYTIYLGNSSCLDGKMSRIPSMIEAISKKNKSGTIDMRLYTEDKKIITFKETGEK